MCVRRSKKLHGGTAFTLEEGVVRSWLGLLGMKADNEGVSVPVLGWEACCLA